MLIGGKIKKMWNSGVNNYECYKSEENEEKPRRNWKENED